MSKRFEKTKGRKENAIFRDAEIYIKVGRMQMELKLDLMQMMSFNTRPELVFISYTKTQIVCACTFASWIGLLKPKPLHLCGPLYNSMFHR